MHDMLVEELRHHEDRATYLVTAHGEPFASSATLGTRVRKGIADAALVDPEVKANGSQHGIRKGVADLMAEAGATEYQLMATFGWTEARPAGVYTRKADRRRTATAAAQVPARAEVGPRTADRGPQREETSTKRMYKGEAWQPVGESNPSFQVENLAS